jgi:pimeloyl-ACP methyl ester carboxylesterase
LLILLISSCNLLIIVDRKQEKKFAKEEMPLHVFRDGKIRRAIHYSDKGREKVVLVHGYGASGIGQYYRAAIDLNKHFDVILPDLLYCGKSSGDSLNFSIDAQVEHLRLLLDSIRVIEPVLLIGNSYGGIVSAYFAEKYPERVKRLVIYDSPVNEYRLSYADSLAKSMDVPSIRELLAPTTIHENKKSLDIVFYDQPYIPRFLRRQMVKYGSIPARAMQLKLLDHLVENEQNYNDYKFEWKIPVHLCWGEFDELIPMQTCHAIMRRYEIPEERLHIFRNAAHAPNVEHPDEFVGYVLGLIRDENQR